MTAAEEKERNVKKPTSNFVYRTSGMCAEHTVPREFADLYGVSASEALADDPATPFDPAAHSNPSDAIVAAVRSAILAARRLRGPDGFITFGHAAREHFALDFDNGDHLNHGSFGGALRCASELRENLQACQNRWPMAFVKGRGAAAAAALATAHAAKLFGFRVGGGLAQGFGNGGGGGGAQDADPAVVFVPNATYGIASVVRSVPLTSEDTIVSTTVAYPSITYAIERRCAETGASHVRIPVRVTDFDPAAFIASITDALRAAPRVALFVVDHVVSGGGLVLPIMDAIAACREAAPRAVIAVDAAQSVGALPLDRGIVDGCRSGADAAAARSDARGADFVVTNFHKWLCVPLSSAGVAVSSRSAFPWFRPAVDSLGTSAGDAGGPEDRFAFLSTSDTSAHLCVTAAAEAFEAMGGVARVHEWTRTAALASADLLASEWGTRTLATSQGSAGCRDALCSSMAAAEVPLPRTDSAVAKLDLGEIARRLDNHFLHHRERCAETCFGVVDGRLWCRVSTPVYCDVQDYRRLATEVPQVVARVVDDVVNMRAEEL